MECGWTAQRPWLHSRAMSSSAGEPLQSSGNGVLRPVSNDCVGPRVRCGGAFSSACGLQLMVVAPLTACARRLLLHVVDFLNVARSRSWRRALERLRVYLRPGIQVGGV